MIALVMIVAIVVIAVAGFAALMWWDDRRYGPFERNDLDR